jgi:hypothetical protein
MNSIVKLGMYSNLIAEMPKTSSKLIKQGFLPLKRIKLNIEEVTENESNLLVKNIGMANFTYFNYKILADLDKNWVVYNGKNIRSSKFTEYPNSKMGDLSKKLIDCLKVEDVFLKGIDFFHDLTSKELSKEKKTNLTHFNEINGKYGSLKFNYDKMNFEVSAMGNWLVIR